jgi:arsenical pump membrane protein
VHLAKAPIPIWRTEMGIITSSSVLFMEEKMYSTIIASNIGAYFTPIGALAGIMWMGILNKTGIKFGFKEFLKYGVIIAPIIICVSLVTLLFIL